MNFFNLFELILLAPFIYANLIYLLLAFEAFYIIFSRKKEIERYDLDALLSGDALPLITFLIPAYNEANVLAYSIQTLLDLSYKEKEIIIVNDGSTDDTLHQLRTTFKFYKIHSPKLDQIATSAVESYYVSSTHPNLFLITKANGGKADALNCGINYAKGEACILLDADTLVDSVELNHLIHYSLLHPEIDAIGGSVRVANGSEVKQRGVTKVHFPTHFLSRMQAVEYLRAFLVGRAGWEFTQGALIISGAFTVMKTSTLRELGGFDTHTCGEDMEIVVRFKRERLEKKQSLYTGFIPQPISWTEVPENWKTLSRQRTRWQIGVLQTLFKHRILFLNPKYKLLGLILVPTLFLCEVLTPFFEIIGYALIGVALFYTHNTYFPLLFLGFSWGLTSLLTLYSVALEQLAFEKYKGFKTKCVMFLFCFIENFGYRQVLVYARIKAVFRFLSKKTAWEVVSKKGFSSGGGGG